MFVCRFFFFPRELDQGGIGLHLDTQVMLRCLVGGIGSGPEYDLVPPHVKQKS